MTAPFVSAIARRPSPVARRLSPVLLLLVSCATSRSPRPAWIERPNLEHPELFVATGSCLGQPSAPHGHACAVRDARERLFGALGLPPETLPGERLLESHLETRESGGTPVTDVWVLLGVPRPEVACSRARAARRLRLGVRCTWQGGSCAAEATAPLEATIAALGFSLMPTRLEAGEIEQRIQPAPLDVAPACTEDAAHTLVVAIEVAPAGEEGGAFYARGFASARFFDLRARTATRVASVGPVKTGAFSARTAADKALHDVLESVGRELEPLRTP